MLKKALFHPSFPTRAETRSFPIFVLIRPDASTYVHCTTQRPNSLRPCSEGGASQRAWGGRVKWRTFLSILISCET